MKRSAYTLMIILAITLGITAPGAFAQKKRGLKKIFNKAARGTLSQKFNYRSKSGDRTGATGRSLNLLKPRFETRFNNKGNKPSGPKP